MLRVVMRRSARGDQLDVGLIRTTLRIVHPYFRHASRVLTADRDSAVGDSLADDENKFKPLAMHRAGAHARDHLTW